MTSSQDRETKFIVEACREQPATLAKSILEQQVKGGLDWNRVFMIAMWNKVLFLVYEKLREMELLDLALKECGLPLILLNHWKQLYRVNRARNETHAEELDHLAKCFDGAGVRYAIGKGGPLLIGRCYSPSGRKSYDIDLLASREQLDAIRETMRLAGYRHAVYSHNTGEHSELDRDEVRKWLLHARGLPNFVRPIDALHMDYIIVQIQFKIGSTVAGGWRDATTMLERAVVTPQGLSAVCDEDLLIQLALHLYRETHEESFDDWSMSWNLIKFCDLARYVRWMAANKGFSALLSRARELNFVPQCVYALDLVQRVYPDECAATLIAALDPDASVRRTLSTSSRPEADLRARFASVGTGAQKRESHWAQLMEPQTT